MSLIIALLALAAASDTRATHIELSCPSEIHTRQEIVSAPNGWRSGVSSLRTTQGATVHRGEPFGFTSGPAENDAFLVPTSVSDSAKAELSTWRIVKGNDTYFSCHYSDTTLLLSQPVPASARTCYIEREHTKHTVRSWCERRT